MAADDHYLLLYDYVQDMADRRGPYRDAHLGRIRASQDEGRIVMAGALGDPVHGAAIVFKGATRAEIEQFIEDDPYVEADLVTKWYIERWKLV
jgi:uncharacterized protein YciI